MPPPPSTTPDSSVGSVQSNSDKPPSTPKSETQGNGNRLRPDNLFRSACFLCANCEPIVVVDDCNRSETTPTSNSSSFLNDSTCHDDDDVDPPAIVIYLVEPVSIGSEDNDLNRLACLALLRCYNNVLSVIPEHIRSNITVQVRSLDIFIFSFMIRLPI